MFTQTINNTEATAPKRMKSAVRELPTRSSCKGTRRTRQPSFVSGSSSPRARGNGVQLTLCLLEGHTRSQTRDRIEVALVVGTLALKTPRDPKLHAGAGHGEIGRHHADHPPALSLEIDRATEDGRVGTEPHLPSAMAEHDDGIGSNVGSGRVEFGPSGFAGRKGPTKDRHRSEHGEKIRRHTSDAHHLGLLVAAERSPHDVPGADPVENDISPPPFLHVSCRNAHLLDRLFQMRAPDTHQLLRLFIGQGFEQDGIDYTEYCGVGADP